MTPKARAAKLYEDFKGERPTRIRRSRLPDHDVTGMEMGPVLGIAYEARRDGKVTPYFHEFKKSARPRLVAQDDGRQLYLDGGNYKVTERGIEDVPKLLVMNPSPRSGAKRKGKTMARPQRRRRRSSTVNIFARNPSRRRRRHSARRSFARNPAPRRRRRSTRTAIFRRNPAPARRRRSSGRRMRSYRRNPSMRGGAVKLGSLVMPAVFIGLGGVASEVVTGYLPIPLAWKTGPMRYVVKAGVGIAAGLVIAKVFKQKRLGYYFAAGAIVLAVHDFTKSLIVQNMPAVKGLNGRGGGMGQYQRSMAAQRLGFTNPATVARFGGGMGHYVRPLRKQFAGDAPIGYARQVGGEMNFAV